MGEAVLTDRVPSSADAEFALVQEINHEPAFDWWLKLVLKKRDRIIASVRTWQTRYLKRSHKFGIELHTTVEQVLTMDAKNDNTLWADAISKEIKNVRVAFGVLPDGKSVPIGHQFVQCHIVFDVKMEDIRCNARLLNDLEVKLGNIFNAYVQA